jgi:hypothetical protein
MRVVSIFFARRISSSRVSRGIVAHLREVHPHRVVDALARRRP